MLFQEDGQSDLGSLLAAVSGIVANLSVSSLDVSFVILNLHEKLYNQYCSRVMDLI